MCIVSPPPGCIKSLPPQQKEEEENEIKPNRLLELAKRAFYGALTYLKQAKNAGPLILSGMRRMMTTALLQYDKISKAAVLTLHSTKRAARLYLAGRLPSFYKSVSMFAFSVPFFLGAVNLGFDLYIGDKYIGVVKGYEHTLTLIESANREYLEKRGLPPMSEPPRLYLRMVGIGGFDDGTKMLENILTASGQMQRAAVIYVNGERLFSAYDGEELHNILEKYKARFENENVLSSEIGAEVDIKNELVLKSEITGTWSAVEALGAYGLPVITKEYKTLSEAVPAPLEKTYDETKRIGNVTVLQEGKSGQKEVMLLITRINGEVAHEEVVEEVMLSAPVAKIESVGTRDPKGIGGGTFKRPVPGEVTSEFGRRWGKMHYGVDFAGSVGEGILAADGGTVIFSGEQEGYGKVIILDHKNGYKTKYAHCSALYFSDGDRVDQGEAIAEIGNTGNSTGPHLHFEILKNDAPVNPLKFVSR